MLFTASESIFCDEVTKGTDKRAEREKTCPFFGNRTCVLEKRDMRFRSATTGMKQKERECNCTLALNLYYPDGLAEELGDTLVDTTEAHEGKSQEACSNEGDRHTLNTFGYTHEAELLAEASKHDKCQSEAESGS